jgi:hypothetical protein
VNFEEDLSGLPARKDAVAAGLEADCVAGPQFPAARGIDLDGLAAG